MRNIADKIALLIGCVTFAISASGSPVGDGAAFIVSTNAPAFASFKQPTNLAELLALPMTNLDQVDVGLINLLCAEGLRGSEDLNVGKNLALLDALAARVASETERYMYRFKEHPEVFLNSLGYFRMQMLGDVLVNDWKMHYDPQRVEQSMAGVNTPATEAVFFADSKDIFLHGLLDGNHYGTCASMPFLYVAIGRRLGYPVNLAATEEHLYVRYEEPDGQHINIEATAVSRFKTPPDEYYRDLLTAANRDAEIKGGGWLRPLSNKEILGHSLLSRLACLQSARRGEEALKTWDIAARYLPDTLRWAETVQDRKMALTADRDLEKRKALWTEIETYPIPDGSAFPHFRNQKIRLHLLMRNGADLATIEKAVGAFKEEVAKSMQPLGEKGTVAVLNLPQPGPPPEVPVATFSFAKTGKKVSVPLNLVPPTPKGDIPDDLVDAIGHQTLDSEEAILNFLWDRYEEAALRQQRAADVASNDLVENGSKPILVPREQIPQEYWNGVPLELELRLDRLTKPQQIVETVRAYQMEQENRKRLEQYNSEMQAMAPPISKPVGYPSQVVSKAIEEQNRQIQEDAKSAAESIQRANSLLRMRIRFVPAVEASGQPGMPGLPNLSLFPNAAPPQQFLQGIQSPSIEKENP